MFGYANVALEPPSSTTVAELKTLIGKQDRKIVYDPGALDLRLAGRILDDGEDLASLSQAQDGTGMDPIHRHRRLQLHGTIDAERRRASKAGRRAQLAADAPALAPFARPWASRRRGGDRLSLTLVRDGARVAVEVDAGAVAGDLADDLTHGGPDEGLRERLGLREPTAYREGPPLDRVVGLLRDGEDVAAADPLREGTYELQVVEDITAALCMEPACLMA
eukprot:CAMPEP_0175406144 /NCGR_PEP_ID=MMETSP0095-20121207/39414_1 /TAXON_ID=311494 /ORGANISM="Alexandrium monilatum, Strain CCMP3105" /LENGTH=220 /DNA_ID=CAMNT_0016704999 /DNA_START=103 /DNA_END=761 /DNA_ORIENTATION=-